MSVRLDNPYNNTSALRKPGMLFGRTYLLRRIYSALANRQSVSLVGLRHMGKSSLLHCMRLPELQHQFAYDFSQYIFVLIDLREYQHKKSEDFFDAVSRQIILQSRGRLELFSQEHNDAHEFSDLLSYIAEKNFHIVLLMDAFDNVTRNPNFDLSFFSLLRSQATLGKISYVTATIAPLHKVCHSSIEESPFFNIFGKYTLTPLEPEEARALATVPAAQSHLPFTTQEVSLILDLAGGHPFFIQRACYILFEEKCHQPNQSIDYDHFTELAYAELEPYFGSIWDRLEPEQQKSLKNLVLFHNASHLQIPELSESRLFRRFMQEKFEQQSQDVTIEALEAALDKLQNLAALGETELQHLRNVSLRGKKTQLTPTERGTLIREVLTDAFERLQGNGYRSDRDPSWRVYNILYYRYFKLHLKNDQIVGRMDFSSTRQFFRERKKAIEALYTILLEMEANPPRKNTI